MGSKPVKGLPVPKEENAPPSEPSDPEKKKEVIDVEKIDSPVDGSPLELDPEMKEMFKNSESFEKLNKIGLENVKKKREEDFGKFIEEEGESDDENDGKKKKILKRDGSIEIMERMDDAIDKWQANVKTHKKEIGEIIVEEVEKKKKKKYDLNDSINKSFKEDHDSPMSDEIKTPKKSTPTLNPLDSKSSKKNQTPNNISNNERSDHEEEVEKVEDDEDDENENEDGTDVKMIGNDNHELREKLLLPQISNNDAYKNNNEEDESEKKLSNRVLRRVKKVEKITETILRKSENKAYLYCILEADGIFYKISIDYALIISTEVIKMNSRIPQKIAFYSIDSFTPFMLIIFKVLSEKMSIHELFIEKRRKVERDGGIILNLKKREIELQNVKEKTVEYTFDLIHSEMSRRMYLIMFVTESGISFMIQHLFEKRDELVLKTMYNIVNTLKIEELKE